MANGIKRVHPSGIKEQNRGPEKPVKILRKNTQIGHSVRNLELRQGNSVNGQKHYTLSFHIIKIYSIFSSVFRKRHQI